jgi:hypothetical protein
MSRERPPGRRNPEAVSPYADMGHKELIGRFYETDGSSRAIGRELGTRLFTHLGFPGDPTRVAFTGRSGEQLQLDGEGIVWADYINFAAESHPEVIESILDALTEGPGEPAYDTALATMQAWLPPGMG